MPGNLAGHTAIVALEVEGAEALARRLAGEGAGVIVVSGEGPRSGRLAAEMAGDGRLGRVAVFCPDGRLEDDLDALVELVTELSRAGRR